MFCTSLQRIFCYSFETTMTKKKPIPDLIPQTSFHYIFCHYDCLHQSKTFSPCRNRDPVLLKKCNFSWCLRIRRFWRRQPTEEEEDERSGKRVEAQDTPRRWEPRDKPEQHFQSIVFSRRAIVKTETRRRFCSLVGFVFVFVAD